MAMQMLSQEVKLWVTRCRQLVGVLQVVELERDNFKAGEGHAKEMGAGFKVKVEQEDLDSQPPGLSDIAAELVDTKDRLAAARAQADDYKARLDTTGAQLDNHNMETTSYAASPSEAGSYLSLDISPDESLSLTNDLHTQLYIAIQTQDDYHREIVAQQDWLSYYRQERIEYRAEVRDLTLKRKTAIAERDSLLRDYRSEQDTLSDGAMDSTETCKALRAEIILANRTLKGAEKDHLASLGYHVGKLDRMAEYIEVGMAGQIESIMRQCDIDPTHIKGDPLSHRAQTLFDGRDLVQSGGGLSGSPPHPAQELSAHIRSTSLCRLDWSLGNMLSSRMDEMGEWTRKHMIDELRERESLGNEALDREIACFRAKVELVPTDYIHAGKYWDITVDTKPSRSDGKALPATWAKMDQLCKGATGSPSSLPDYEYIRSTQHGRWPEVILAIYSWSFYKIHDSTFDESFESQQLLADLFRIWWESGADSFSEPWRSDVGGLVIDEGSTPETSRSPSPRFYWRFEDL